MSKVALLLALLAVAACGSPELELAHVDPPPDLSQLDETVREQFATLWREHEESPRESSARGAAWGALGQWFDVYRYAASAEKCYRNARALQPAEPRWPYYLGRLAEAGGDFEAAQELFSAAAELAPGEPAPRVRLGDLALRRQDAERAEVLYREVLAAHPQDPGALLGSGRLALLRGDAAAALEPLEALASRQPEASEVQYALGLAWRQLGDDARAAEHLGRVPEENLDQVWLQLDDPWERELKLLDQGARNLTFRGVRAFRRGENGQAMVLLGRAVAADPDSPEVRINFALALRETGRAAAAAEELEEALRLAEAGSDAAAKAHLELGRLLAARGRPAAAIPHLEATLAIDPQSVVAHVELGRVRQAQGRFEEALGHYGAARAIDRPLPEVRFWYSALLLVMERWRDARTALEEDLQKLGDDRRLSLLLARLLAAAPEPDLRDPARARRLLAAEAAGPDVLFAETAAMVAAAAGHFAEAVAWQRAAADALAGVRPRTAAQTARRRLVLYERDEPCRHPWEERETPIAVEVREP